jgi:hypothetical protein
MACGDRPDVVNQRRNKYNDGAICRCRTRQGKPQLCRLQTALPDLEESSNFTILGPLGLELMKRRLKDKSILKKNRLTKGSLHLLNLIFDDSLALD